MAASCPPKRGLCCRKNQAWEGDKVDGTGRWPGHSFGSATGECFPGGSHARRNDDCSRPRPVLGTGSSAAETETDNRRSSLRLEPAAGPATEARHPVVGAASAQPAALVETRRKKATSLQEKMESRAHVCLVAKLPPPAGAPRPHPDGLSWPVPLRLLTHHAEVFMKPALETASVRYKASL